VVQETFLRAHRGLRRFRGDAAVTTWLHRIAVNRALTLLERRQRRPVVSLEADATRDHLGQVAAAAHGAASERADLREDLRAALAELPPKLRAVVVLRDVEDLPHAEIAVLLGISETAAKVRLHRARRQLRDRLYGGAGAGSGGASGAGARSRSRGERGSGAARAL
jgi:RNA polymerase sigma-70 factor (ECF subfamily)